jgi:hypothetical protein
VGGSAVPGDRVSRAAKRAAGKGGSEQSRTQAQGKPVYVPKGHYQEERDSKRPKRGKRKKEWEGEDSDKKESSGMIERREDTEETF